MSSQFTGRRIRGAAQAMLLTAAVTACGSSGDDVVSDIGTAAATDAATEVSSTDTTASDTTVPQATTSEPLRETVPATTGIEVEDVPLLFVGGALDEFNIPAAEPEQVQVVLAGPEAENQPGFIDVPILVANGTNGTVGDIVILVIAKDADGYQVGSGAAAGLQPVLVEPGSVAFGTMSYSKAPNIANIELQFGYNSPEQVEGRVALGVLDAVAENGALVGEVMNAGPEAVSGPIDVGVACLDEAVNLLSVEYAVAESDRIDANESATFEIGLDGKPCPVYLVGGTGVP